MGLLIQDRGQIERRVALARHGEPTLDLALVRGPRGLEAHERVERRLVRRGDGLY